MLSESFDIHSFNIKVSMEKYIRNADDNWRRTLVQEVNICVLLYVVNYTVD